MSHFLLRSLALVLGILGALTGALAVTVFGMWLLDGSSGSAVSRELWASLGLALLCGVCVIGRRVLRVREARAGLDALTAPR